MKNKMIDVLNEIISDCEKDARDFEGREFNGKTLGELHGILEAKIQALAKIMKAFIERDNKKADLPSSKEFDEFGTKTFI